MTGDNDSSAQLDALNQAITLHMQNRLAEAEAGYRALIDAGTRIPDAYTNLARICGESGRPQEAVALLGQALQINRHHLPSLILLGLSFKAIGDTQRAELCYRAALEVDPDIPEVLYNLGNLLQEKNQLAEAEQCYRRALSKRPQFALAHYNLGNVRRDRGSLQDAISHYREAIRLDPASPAPYNNLGNALAHRDELDEAIALYREALQRQPDFPDAMYNLGNALYLLGDLEQAQPWFARAQIRDWRARCLYCFYKSGQHAQFTRELQAALADPHHSPQIASLSAHHAINTGEPDPYTFCPQPLAHVYQRNLPQLAGASSPLRQALLDTIAAVEMSERHQGRLHHGVQSAGNLFLREEAPLRELAQLIRREFIAYRNTYSGSDCSLVRDFPSELEFESAWYIRMRQGGHLAAHIHETGWLSGAVYLALPDAGASGDEGMLELSLHGDDYPIAQGEFPTRTVALNTGDIVLFPSSLFHRTIPYHSAQERICIAFDLKPQPGRSPV